MPTRTLQQKLKNLPSNPGVYLFKNAGGEILYVGKAKILKNRVRSYFNSSHDQSIKTQQLVANIADWEYVLTDTEAEALMLENNLIKRHLPRYNIMLKDDKNYQFIKIDYSTEIPQIYTVRKIEGKSKAKYFGPYTSGKAVKAMLHLMRYIIPYCANKKIGPRPCFYFHLNKCPGVCNGSISQAEYQKTMLAVERFLRGDFREVLEELKIQMARASSKQLFEQAARLRDQIAAMEKMLERQKIISPVPENFDSLALFSAGNLAGVNLMQVRSGRLVNSQNFLLENTKGAAEEEVLSAFLEKYYLEASDIPAEINVPCEVENDQVLAAVLKKQTGHKVSVNRPSRGRKKKLIKMGEKNARDYLEKSAQNLDRENAVLTRALFELKEKLHLPQLPFRIECYDISNIQGTSPVGSMVIFENGKPKKSDYKRFAIRGPATPNDVGMMREMLERRFAHTEIDSPLKVRGAGGVMNATHTDSSWRLPDLLMVDGGRAQLNTALSVLKKNKLKIPALGLAKKLEEIYLPQLKAPLRLPADSAALRLLQRIRDEAHRFAIAYHRKKRSKEMLEG